MTAVKTKSKRHKSIIDRKFKFKNSKNCIESIDSIETHAYGTSKDLVSEKEQIK